MKKALSFLPLLCGLLQPMLAQQKLTANTFAHDSTAAPVAATIADVAWLAGRWSGEGFGGWLEEVWTPPAGGQMLATFRMHMDGKPVFSEICQIAEENGTLLYKVKHFNPDLTSWEEKNDYVTFHLVKMEPNAVYFSGLTMKESNGRCDLWLALRQEDGTHQEEHLYYLRDAPQGQTTTQLPGRKVNIPQDADHLARLREIDRDIWVPFSEAYAAGDAERYIALHTTDLIRATGGIWAGLQDLNTYGANSRQFFKNNVDAKRRAEIAFTFFERVADASTASERGIYRFTSIGEDGSRQHHYGKFHVFLRKTGGQWKIAVDYDSDEDGTVGEADFAAGLPPGVFAK
jgi:ketosteroid isomerase-like protein